MQKQLVTCDIYDDTTATVLCDVNPKIPGLVVGFNPFTGSRFFRQERYALIHSASGLVAGRASTKRQCWEFAKMLAPLGDWTPVRQDLPEAMLKQGSRLMRKAHMGLKKKTSVTT
jgi:hypothetical protein